LRDVQRKVDLVASVCGVKVSRGASYRQTFGRVHPITAIPSSSQRDAYHPETCLTLAYLILFPSPTQQDNFCPPDPKKITRADFTDFFMRFQHAPDAHSTYKHLFVTHQQLVKLLLEHPAMQPNLQQTFSTSANSKNQVYFMWDFILRTIQILAAQVDSRDPYSSPTF
jgi:hypothetical protein